MKMKIFDRILLVLLTLFGIALFLGAVACACDVIPSYIIKDYVDLIYSNLINRIILGAIALIGLIICVKLLFSHERKPYYPSAAVIKQGEFGTVTITVKAIDVLVQKAAHSVDGLRDLKSTVEVKQDGLNVVLKVALSPETVIPETADLLQKAVKDYVEKFAGLKVLTVKVLVDESATYINRVG